LEHFKMLMYHSILVEYLRTMVEGIPSIAKELNAIRIMWLGVKLPRTVLEVSVAKTIMEDLLLRPAKDLNVLRIMVLEAKGLKHVKEPNALKIMEEEHLLIKPVLEVSAVITMVEERCIRSKLI